MQNEYIEERNGGYYVSGTRISLDSVVYTFNAGNSPEAIQNDFPLLTSVQLISPPPAPVWKELEILNCSSALPTRAAFWLPMIDGQCRSTSAHTCLAGKSSPGVLIVSQGVPLASAVDSIILIWAASQAEELRNQIHHLPSLARHIFNR
jgi:hypothetical protein